MTDNDMAALAAWVAFDAVEREVNDEWLHEEIPGLVDHDIARLADALSEIVDELSIRAGDRGHQMWTDHQ